MMAANTSAAGEEAGGVQGFSQKNKRNLYKKASKVLEIAYQIGNPATKLMASDKKRQQKLLRRVLVAIIASV